MINMTYLKIILIGLYDDLIEKYDGKKIKDKSGTLKFENGMVFSKEKDDNNKYDWKTYNYRELCIEDLILDLESIIEQLQIKNTCIIGFSVNNTGII